jgi:prolipoprotein diacylglyceryltransferase
MVLFYLPGGIPIYAFSLMLAFGAVLGLVWSMRGVVPIRKRLARFEAGLWALLGALLGGRAAYVALNWTYFQDHPLHIPQIQLGGLSGPGALTGGFLALGIVALFRRQSLPRLADALLPLAVIMTVAVWLGCWLDGSAYGWPLSAWWAIPTRDQWSVISPRWPLQLFGALASLALLWLLERFARRFEWRPGVLAAMGVLGLSTILFLLSFLRADVALIWRGLRLEAWGALAIMAAAVCALLVLQITRPRE